MRGTKRKKRKRHQQLALFVGQAPGPNSQRAAAATLRRPATAAVQPPQPLGGAAGARLARLADLYAGDKLITTLTDKVWEKRLVGDSIWLVECYAAWCPACQNYVSTWRETARALIANDDELEIGAVNCEKQRAVCGEWFEISSYPSVMLINREYGMVQRYPKSRDKAPELVREWALTISREWRYLMAASNVTMVTAAEFPKVVLNSTWEPCFAVFSR